MKADIYTGFSGQHLELIAAADLAGKAIPPMWPLEATVAVNPFLGQTEQSLAEVAARLERVAGENVTLSRDALLAQIENGTITDEDLQAALDAAPVGGPATLDALKTALNTARPDSAYLPTVAALAAEAAGTDWPALVTERIGVWAAGFFDEGQALWSAAPGLSAFESWQVFAERDLSAEIAGLSGFTNQVSRLPHPARRTLSQACDILGVIPQSAETYFHQLLLEMGGWSQLARKELFVAEMSGETTHTLSDLLTLRLVWESALFEQYQDEIADKWAETLKKHEAPVTPGTHHLVDTIVQEAAERAYQRQLSEKFAKPAVPQQSERPKLQAAFCIDVRSERFRRALEQQDTGIETLGFAGFFGLGAAHQATASDVMEHRLPVLLSPQLTSHTEDPADLDMRLSSRASRAWGRFRQAAVSSFAFVEASGPLYAGKLLRDALGMPTESKVAAQPQLSDDVTLEQKITMAGTILGAMSLTSNFAPTVLVLGHGARVTNNAHASALQCGACGGYAGDVNARLLAGLLNAPDVREGLLASGMEIPADTKFVAGLHNTTTDEITLYTSDLPQPIAAGDRKAIETWLVAATQIAAAERALKLPRAATGADVTKRALDWSETRPEWGLAGCSAFVAAPRHRTQKAAMDGRTFLHDYEWAKDENFGILELILTAPVVVASWISLAYYGSVVAPKTFGGGNKLLHNVCGGVGTLEGNGGAPRAGLPWQSVHDGNTFMHDALRLSVVIEAPVVEINKILDKHPSVKALFDNRWLHLFVMNEEGQLSRRYTRDLNWEDVRGPNQKARNATSALSANAA
ncbi:MAG: YbcC family protein [Roseobacter sp.]